MFVGAVLGALQPAGIPQAWKNSTTGFAQMSQQASLLTATRVSSAPPVCSEGQCTHWADFCDDWDDQQQACYHQCVPYCVRANLCNNRTAQDQSADAPDLDSACPSP